MRACWLNLEGLPVGGTNFKLSSLYIEEFLLSTEKPGNPVVNKGRGTKNKRTKSHCAVTVLDRIPQRQPCMAETRNNWS